MEKAKKSNFQNLRIKKINLNLKDGTKYNAERLTKELSVLKRDSKEIFLDL